MHKIFYPDSILIIGLSSKPNNIPRMILENLLRWGFRGRIFGVNKNSEDEHVDGIKMYRSINELPEIPDLAVCLIPAKYIPETVQNCGEFGIRYMAISSGGFSEFGESGKRLADETLHIARQFGIRIVGPNGVTVANTANNLCLPFVPLYRPPIGGLSIISQSGGVALMMLNLLAEENVGMAKFASIGNKLDLDEVDFLQYFGADPETRIICMYLESIERGQRFLEVARSISKPIVVFKSNTTSHGSSAAMTHTAAMRNDDAILDEAFQDAGIIRICNYADFISVAKAFDLPPMLGNRIMIMSPAGGFSVIAADLCENAGFSFSNPGEDFYAGLQKFSNAGVITFSNPLDMGDIYDQNLAAHVIFNIMHNREVDGAIYISQRPHMPRGEDVFTKMFTTDLSKETWGTILSSGKPLGICLFGPGKSISQIKRIVNFPIFNSPEEMVRALAIQKNFYQRKNSTPAPAATPTLDREAASRWIQEHPGNSGEELLDLLRITGVPTAQSVIAVDESEAVVAAQKLGYPVAVKVLSPDALHKSDVGGVILDCSDSDAVVHAFSRIRENLSINKPGARFCGVRIQSMAAAGHDCYIGGTYDRSFGPVIFFGAGGIFLEVYRDFAMALCPTSHALVKTKLEKIRYHAIIRGARGQRPVDTASFIESIVRISHLLSAFPQIRELDINPIRIFPDGSCMALDARCGIGVPN